MLLFATNQKLVVPAIWKSLGVIGGTDLISNVLDNVSQILADHYLAKVTATEPEDRLRELMDAFNEEGALVEVNETNGQMLLYKRSCPFISMVDEHRSICCVDQDMMSKVVGKAYSPRRLPPRRRSLLHLRDRAERPATLILLGIQAKCAGCSLLRQVVAARTALGAMLTLVCCVSM